MTTTHSKYTSQYAAAIEHFSGISDIDLTELWEEPEPLGPDLPPVAVMDADLLPDSLRPFIEDISQRMQVPLDLPGATAIAMLAGVVGRRAVIQPYRNDDSWTVVPNLWGAIVAPPSSMKSGVISIIAKPLHEIERAWFFEDEQRRIAYEAQAEEHRLKKQAWEKAAAKSLEIGRQPSERPQDLESAPSQRRLITQDATHQKLHALNEANPAGMFVLLDELTGWLVGIEDASRKAERQYFLTAWNGDTPFAMDRVGRGTVRVPHTCISLFGGIQPGPLRHYLSSALRDGSGDGLAQRFQLLVWPDSPKGQWIDIDRAPNRTAMEQAAAIFQRLARLDPVTPRRYRFEPQAQSLFVKWRSDLESRLRAEEDSEAISAHLSKYRSLMPALALLFWLADDGSRDFVPLAHTQRACDWCDYLETHARRVYSSQCSSEQASARSLGRKIAAGKLGRRFTQRDTYRSAWSGLTTAGEAGAAIRQLEAMNWIRRIAKDSKPGRPSSEFVVNPLLEPHHAGL